MQKSRGNSPHLHHVEAPPYVSSLLLQTARQTAGFSFSQKSFAMQNIFGSPNILWCPRCVFHTPKSTTSQHCAVCERLHLCNRYAFNAGCSFSQKSFATQNLFGSPDRLWCPRCVFHTQKSTKIKSRHFTKSKTTAFRLCLIMLR